MIGLIYKVSLKLNIPFESLHRKGPEKSDFETIFIGIETYGIASASARY
jgi:hypothetical protein